MKRLPAIVIVALGFAWLSFSRSKTVEWDEEVPLSTGETILVHRADVYKGGSEPGNPFKSGWWIKNRRFDFFWRGQKYSYDSSSFAGGDPMLLYIYPSEQIVALVAYSKDCQKAGYAEFRWMNGEWVVQQNLNPALIGLPRNLMEHSSAEDGDIPQRVTQEWIRQSRFDLPQRGGSLTHLPESKISANCTRSK